MSVISEKLAEQFGLPHAFFTAVFDRGDWTAEQHVKAVYGFTMREHADAAHPEQVEHIAELSTAGMGEADREAWLFGYRFRDRPAPGGDNGDGNARDT